MGLGMMAQAWNCSTGEVDKESSGILGYMTQNQRKRRRRRTSREEWKRRRRKMTLTTRLWDPGNEMNQERKFQSGSQRISQGCSFIAGLESHQHTQEKDSRRDLSKRKTERLERCV